MVLTLPALFVYIEIKDYIPAAFAGAPPVCSVSPRGARPLLEPF